ncbi:MAG: GTPase [Candidatus Bathyarchaeia archaeon]
MPVPAREMRQLIKKRLQGLTPDQKIREIDRILKEFPWTVGDYKVIRSELRRQQEAERGLVSARHSAKGTYYIKKEAPQSMIVGLPNSGKSTLLASLTGAGVRIAAYPFTTQKPELGSLSYNDVRIQMVELPSFYSGVSIQNRALISLLRTTDAVIEVVNKAKELKVLSKELEESGIRLYNRKTDDHEKYSEDYIFLPAIVVYRNAEPETELEAISFQDDERIKEELYQQLNITRIYLRDMAGNVDLPPVVFLDMQEVYVEDLAKRIGPKYLKSFRYARIWGASANYQGEKVGLRRRLEDGETVTVYTS